ncbi:DedA family protein [Plantactinospora sp. GCM10030261]|uniref:DedA family protein n=1 Tax=Plantactinospora sp. GCM10030261 TaxID=3273420 RepID=UPI0036215B11
MTATLIDWLGGLPPAGVYLVAAVLLAAEVGILLGVAVPAATTMLTVGALAHSGRLDLGTVLIVCVAAAFAGDQLGFVEGRLAGDRVRRGRLGRRIGADRWARADELLMRRGGPAVLVGRWMAVVRTIVPRVAGAAGLPYRRFVAYNAAGVVVWVPGTVLLGYAGGASYARLPGVPTWACVLGAATLAVLLWLRHRHRAAPITPPI